MDLLNTKNNYSPIVKDSCLIWRNHSLQWLDLVRRIKAESPHTHFSEESFPTKTMLKYSIFIPVHFQTFIYPGKKILSNFGMVFLSCCIISIFYLNSDIVFTVILFTYAKRKGILWLDAMRVPVCWSLWSCSRCFVEASHSLKPLFHASVLFRMVRECLKQRSGEERFILI